MSSLLDDMTDARLPWTSPTVARWYEPQALRDQLRESMRRDAGWVGDTGFGTEFRDGIGSVDVPDPAAWANRRLAVGEGQWCVTGTRFRARDVTKPFVDVVATSVPPTPDGLAAVAQAVVPAYEAFRPRALRVDAPDPDGLVAELRADGRFAGADVDQRVVAGLVTTLRTEPRSRAHARVRLEAVATGDVPACAAEVAESYVGVDPLWSRPQSQDELVECADAGLLFRALVDGAPVGVVGALRDDDHGLTGFQVQELLVRPDRRGQGLGPALVQHLVDRLPAAPADTLWGTIQRDNQPSLRSARSVGRQVVGGYVWVVPVGLPGMAHA